MDYQKYIADSSRTSLSLFLFTQESSPFTVQVVKILNIYLILIEMCQMV